MVAFARILTSFGFRFKLISVKHLVFGFPTQKNAFIVIKVYKQLTVNLKHLTAASNKGFVPTSITVFYNFVKFLACFYKTVTYVWRYLNLICLFFKKY